MPMDGRYSAKSQEGAAVMPMDGRADICSCNICTSTIRGGRISQGAKDGGAMNAHGWADRYLLLGNCSSATAPALP